MTIEIKNSWDAVTWREYEQLEQILKSDIPNDYKAVHLISVLTGKEVEELEQLPITEFKKLLPSLGFMQNEPDTHAHKFEYTINMREYEFKANFQDITTAQYIDYRSYMNEEEKDVVKLMSCFLIPKGHEYNDGYDMDQVMSDIGDMCWLDVRAAAFFFRLQLAAFTLILKSYLRKTMKRAKAKKQDIKQVEESLNSLAYSLLYSGAVNLPIQTLIP